MHKKTILLSILALSLIFSACGSNAENSSAAESAAISSAEEEPEGTPDRGGKSAETAAEPEGSSLLAADNPYIQDSELPEPNPDTGAQQEFETAPQQDVGYEGMESVGADELNPGSYAISVDSSSSMFNITECVLEVSGDSMSAHMVMSGTAYAYIYAGTGADAEEAGEESWIADEAAEGEKNTFTFPVEALDTPTDCAAYSKNKQHWYDRTLCFRADSLPDEAFAESRFVTAEDLGLEDGSYTVNAELSGGSGRASVESPCHISVSAGKVTARVVMSSSNYDYMIVDGEKYLTVNTEGNSAFEIPVKGFDHHMTVYADTTAMSVPYEIEYRLYFDSESLVPEL